MSSPDEHAQALEPTRITPRWTSATARPGSSWRSPMTARLPRRLASAGRPGTGA